MVCALGGHTYRRLEPYGPDMSLVRRQHHHLRLLFWLCYISDKDISLRSGQPPLLTKDYCDLTIPEYYANYYAHLSQLDIHISHNQPHLYIPGDQHLCFLKEKICRLLYSPQAFKISDGVLLLRIRQLDDELESWRTSIPADFRPKLSIPPNQLPPTAWTNALQNIRYIYLQLEYHHLMTVIHTAVRRCGADDSENGDVSEDLHTVIHSSCDLSLEASRSTLTFLKSCVPTLVEEEFR